MESQDCNDLSELRIGGLRDRCCDAPLGNLLERQYDSLLRLLSRHCRQHIEAMDLLQEALRITIEHHATGRIANVQAAPGYAYRVALNLLRNSRRTMLRRSKVLADDAAIDEYPIICTADELSTEPLSVHVRRALASLRMRRDRQIIQRHYVDGEDKATVCRELRLTQASFDRLAHRARQRMKQILIEDGFSMGDLVETAME